MNENSESFDLVSPKFDESKKLKIVIHHTPRGVNEFYKHWVDVISAEKQVDESGSP